MRCFLITFSVVCLLSGCGEVELSTADSVDGSDATAEANNTVAATDDAQAAASSETENVTMVTFKVPEMNCPFACYPSVKKTLEAQPGVAGVELVKQEKEGVINDRRVVISTSDKFDAEKAIAALAESGFGDSVVDN